MCVVCLHRVQLIWLALHWNLYKIKVWCCSHYIPHQCVKIHVSCEINHTYPSGAKLFTPLLLLGVKLLSPCSWWNYCHHTLLWSRCEPSQITNWSLQWHMIIFKFSQIVLKRLKWLILKNFQKIASDLTLAPKNTY